MGFYGFKERPDAIAARDLARKYQVLGVESNLNFPPEGRPPTCRHYVVRVTVAVTAPDLSDLDLPVPGTGKGVVYVFEGGVFSKKSSEEIDIYTLDSTAAIDDIIVVHQDVTGQFWISGGKGGAAAVATVEDIIPARSGDTPGGPITATIRNSTNGADFADGSTVDVYSWVKTDSADPADETDGKLYIFMTQGQDGTWWFTAQDCTEPQTSIDAANLTSDTVLSTTPQELAGTGLLMPSFQGVYSYEAYAQIIVSGVPGNQAWDLTIELYNQTDGNVIKSWGWSGLGNPPSNPQFDINYNLNLDNVLAGDNTIMRAYRATSTGTITLDAVDAQGNPATGNALTGPL